MLASEKVTNLLKITMERLHLFLHQYQALYPKTSHFCLHKMGYNTLCVFDYHTTFTSMTCYGVLHLAIQSSEASKYHTINSFGMNGLFQWK